MGDALADDEGTPLLSKNEPRIQGDSDMGSIAFESAGIRMPCHLKTRFRRWMSLFFVIICTTIPSGPLASFPTLEPILIKMGVFAGPDQKQLLSQVFSIASGLATISFFFSGVLYDNVGPRAITVGSCIAVAICMFLMHICILYEQLNSLLFVVYPLLTLFGSMTLFGAYSFLWLLPGAQNTVNALAISVQALSDSLVIVIVLLYKNYGVSLGVSFQTLAALSLASAAATYFVLPSKEEHLRNANAILQYQAKLEGGIEHGEVALQAPIDGHEASKEEGGADEVDEADAVAAQSCWRKQVDQVRYSLRLIFRVRPLTHTIWMIHAILFYLFIMYPLIVQYPFYFAMFGKNGAEYLVNIYALIYGVFGAVSLFVLGRIVDWLGVAKSQIFACVVGIALIVCIMQRSVGAQVAAQGLQTLLINVVILIITRVCMLYGAVEIFGTYTGILCSLLGIAQMLFTPLIPALASIVYPHSNEHLQRYLVSFSTLGWAMVASGAVLGWYWKKNPPPAAGSVTLDDIKGN
eukprot:g1836.t1